MEQIKSNMSQPCTNFLNSFPSNPKPINFSLLYLYSHQMIFQIPQGKKAKCEILINETEILEDANDLTDQLIL